MPRAVGIAGIEKRLAENHHRTHESISQVLHCVHYIIRKLLQYFLNLDEVDFDLGFRRYESFDGICARDGFSFEGYH